MVRRKSEWPSAGELVVSTVTKVFDQGAFVSLDEYGGKEGMVHLSEVASGWIKNIRDHVREGQKVVCKVLAIDPSRNLVDLSIRRVKDSERRWKTERLKLEQRAEKLLELAAKKLGKTLDQAYEEVGFPLQEKFGDVYAAFEVTAKDPGSLKEIVKDKRWLKALVELAAATVQPPTYKVVGHVELSCTAPDGVEVIKSAMIRARKAVEEGDVRAEFYLVGSPRYRLEVSAPSYKVAESALRQVAELAIGFVTKAGGKGEFKRGSK
jgi:translation initiation factor 2 subunit 1